MRLLRFLGWAAAVAALALANRAEAQFMYGYGGALSYGHGIRYAASPFGSVVSVRGSFGGRVTVAEGPFGGGAFGVRGSFGGRYSVVRPPVVAVPPIVPVAPVTMVQQTVLNPAPALMPYSAPYVRRIPPGLPVLAVGGRNYYYTPVLPLGAQATTVGGAPFYVSNGVSYQPYFLGMNTVYLVVEL